MKESGWRQSRREEIGGERRVRGPREHITKMLGLYRNIGLCSWGKEIPWVGEVWGRGRIRRSSNCSRCFLCWESLETSMHFDVLIGITVSHFSWISFRHDKYSLWKRSQRWTRYAWRKSSRSSCNKVGPLIKYEEILLLWAQHKMEDSLYQQGFPFFVLP